MWGCGAVFHMDCEWQCFDRTHRMGQTKDVTIYKFITKDSIRD